MVAVKGSCLGLRRGRISLIPKCVIGGATDGANESALEPNMGQTPGLLWFVSSRVGEPIFGSSACYCLARSQCRISLPPTGAAIKNRRDVT
jgi:hypothetical protein